MRYKILFTLYVLFFVKIGVQGQTSLHTKDTLVKKEPRIWVGLSFSPDFCFRTNINYQDKDQYKPTAGYSYYFNLKCRISKNIFIKTGFSFHKMGYQTKALDSIPYYNNGVKYVLNSRFVYSSIYYGIPVLIDYRIKTKNKKVFFNISSGIEISWLPKDGYKIINSKGEVMDSYYYIVGNGYPVQSSGATTYKPFPRFIGILNAGLSYKLNKCLVYSLEPTFKYVSKSNITTSGYALYSIGLNMGLSYTFL